MNWQTPRDYRSPRDFDPMTPRMSSGSGPIQSQQGLIRAIYRDPYFWGAAIAFTISGLLGMVTL